MTLDNQRGGAFVYQWVLATLICCECYAQSDDRHIESLPNQVFGFLGPVDQIQLEAKRDEQGKETEEDVNLYDGQRWAFVQIKARGEDQKNFGVSEVAKFFANFYRSGKAHGTPEDHLYLLASNGAYHDRLRRLKDAVNLRPALESSCENRLLKSMKDIIEHDKSPEPWDEDFARRVLARTQLFTAPRIEQIENGLSHLLTLNNRKFDVDSLVTKIAKISTAKHDQDRIVTLRSFQALLNEFRLPESLAKKLIRPDLALEVEELVIESDDWRTSGYDGQSVPALTLLEQASKGVDSLSKLSEKEIVLLSATAALARLETRAEKEEKLKGYSLVITVLGRQSDLIHSIVTNMNSKQDLELPSRVSDVRPRLLGQLLRLGTLLAEIQALPGPLEEAPDIDSLARHWRGVYLQGLTECESDVLKLEYAIPASRKTEYEEWFIRPYFDGLQNELSEIRTQLLEYNLSVRQMDLCIVPLEGLKLVPSHNEKKLKDHSNREELIRGIRKKLDFKLEQSRLFRDEVASVLSSLEGEGELQEENALTLLQELKRIDQFAQARRFAEKIAKAAQERGDRDAASRFKLEAVEAIFEGGFPPELATEHLNINNLPSHLELQYLRAEARHEIGRLNPKGAIAAFERLPKLIKQMGTQVNWARVADVIVHSTFPHVLNQDWEAADEALREYFHEAKEDHVAVSSLLTTRLNLAYLSGLWEIGLDALDHFNHIGKGGTDFMPQRRLQLAMADFYVRCGEVDKGIALYGELEEDSDSEDHGFLALVLRNSLYTTSNSGLFYQDLQRREDLRIDLFQTFEASKESARRMDSAYRSYAEGKYRIGLQQIWLAQEQCWIRGDWIPLENCLRLQARLYQKDNRILSAVCSSVLAGDVKLTQSFVDGADEKYPHQSLSDAIQMALDPSPLARVEQGKFEVLRSLSDSLNCEQFTQLLTRINAKFEETPRTRMDSDAISSAAKTLVVVASLPDEEHREQLLRLILSCLEIPDEWCQEQGVRALEEFGALKWSLTVQERLEASEALLRLFERAGKLSHLKRPALELVAEFLEECPEEQKQFGRELEKKNALEPDMKALLRMPISPEIVDEMVQGIFLRLAPKPLVKGRTVEYSHYLTSASELLRYLPYIKDDGQLLRRIVDTFRSPDCPHANRASLARFLIQVPRRRLAEWVDFLRPELFSLYRESFELNEFNRRSQARTSIFSALRFKGMSEVEVRRSLLRALGCILAHSPVDEDLSDLFYREAFSLESTIRTGVAEGLVLAGEHGLELTPKLSQTVLFLAGSDHHDIRRVSAAAIGWLVSTHSPPQEGTMVDVLLNLTGVGEAAGRATTAWALNRIWHNRQDLHSKYDLSTVLGSFANDPSRKVRIAASTRADWLKVGI